MIACHYLSVLVLYTNVIRSRIRSYQEPIYAECTYVSSICDILAIVLNSQLVLKIEQPIEVALFAKPPMKPLHTFVSWKFHVFTFWVSRWREIHSSISQACHEHWNVEAWLGSKTPIDKWTIGGGVSCSYLNKDRDEMSLIVLLRVVSPLSLAQNDILKLVTCTDLVDSNECLTFEMICYGSTMWGRGCSVRTMRLDTVCFICVWSRVVINSLWSTVDTWYTSTDSSCATRYHMFRFPAQSSVRLWLCVTKNLDWRCAQS